MTSRTRQHQIGPEIGPAPHGRGLVLTVDCSTTPGSPGSEHLLVIHPDWSVDTGHDLESERIAVALGGHSSCVALVDRVVPAFRAAMQLHGRRTLPAVVPCTWPAGWSLDDRSDGMRSCSCTTFEGLSSTVTHARSVRHLAQTYGFAPAQHWLLNRLHRLVRLSAVSYGGFHRPPRSEVQRIVRESDGARLLWGLGIHPGLAFAIHQTLWSEESAVPADLYAAVAYRRPGFDYLRRVIAASPEPAVATWAAATERAEDRRDPDARASVLRGGARPDDLVAVMAQWFSVADVRDLAAGTDGDVASAAAALAQWVTDACRPRIADLCALYASTGTCQGPDPEDLDRLMKSPSGGQVRSRTEAGLLLAACRGDVARAAALICSGVRRLDEVPVEL